MKSTEKEKARSKDIKAGESDLSVIRPPTAITSSTRNVAAHYSWDKWLPKSVHLDTVY